MYQLEKISKFITLIFGITLFQVVGIIDQKYCESKIKSDKKNWISVCSTIKNLKLTYPANFAIEQFETVREYSKDKEKTILLMSKKVTSGMIGLDQSLTRDRFDSINNGFSFNYKKGSRKNAGYLLLASGDPQKGGEPLVELWDLNNQVLVHKWNFDMEKILGKLSDVNVRKADSLYFMNPLLLDDGSIIVNDLRPDGPLLKISSDGELIKTNKEYEFHHSLDIDSQGKLYVPIRMGLAPSGKFKDEGFAIVDQDLSILKVFSLSDIFKKAGLNYQIFSKDPTSDPFHINDVAPLINDKQTSVVLISLRSLSSIMAYDIKNEKLIWILNGYSSQQHDVDILDKEGSLISFFDNNIVNDCCSVGNKFTMIDNLPSLKDSSENELLIFNYPSNHAEERLLDVKIENFEFLPKSLRPTTHSSGTAEYIKNNQSVFMEESNFGRALEYDLKTNKLLWQYINRDDSNDLYYRMSWSRRLDSLPTNLINNLSSNIVNND
tara:strand:+ start:1311 stop:2789 length:1479 start_codon:yes stop_codon:yes gene_type:complete